MTLSDNPSANIDWKLNQLLSASKASRVFVARQTVAASADKTGFSPWAPRDLTASSITTPPRQFADEFASGTLSDPAEIIDEACSKPEQHKDAPETAEGMLMNAGDLEQIRTAAFEQGKRHARAEFAEDAAQNERRFGELIDNISAERVDFKKFKASLNELSLFIATQVVRAEITVNPEWHYALVDSCLEEIRRHGNDLVTVRLSRVDFDLHHARLLKGHESVAFTPDDRLEAGDVEVEMGATLISELIETKLGLIARQMLASLLADNAGQADASECKMLQEVY